MITHFLVGTDVTVADSLLWDATFGLLVAISTLDGESADPMEPKARKRCKIK